MVEGLSWFRAREGLGYQNEGREVVQLFRRDTVRVRYVDHDLALPARPRSSLHALRVSAGAARPAHLPAPPTAGIDAVLMACFLINMIPGYSRRVCSRTFESLRLVHNVNVELTSELAMNLHEDSVPFGTHEPISFGGRNLEWPPELRQTVKTLLAVR
jgi:hypothetical protein